MTFDEGDAWRPVQIQHVYSAVLLLSSRRAGEIDITKFKLDELNHHYMNSEADSFPSFP